MGIRKKIMLGFLCLGATLAFSGAISMIELDRLSTNTRDLLSSSMRNMAFSRSMLDAVQEQNTSLLQMVVLNQTEYDSTFVEAKRQFEISFAEASGTAGDWSELDSILVARDNYNAIVYDYLNTPGEKDVEWFMNMYGSLYLQLTSSIKDYMQASQELMLNKAGALERNAYRAIMPGIITLCVAIIIVVVFAFLINIYYIRPIMRISKGLDGYLKYKLPYKVEVGGNDELARLGDQIDELTGLTRKKIME